jgi:hypothetical protein
MADPRLCRVAFTLLLRDGRLARQSVGDRAGGRRFLHLVRRLRVPTSGVRASILDCPEAVDRERQFLAELRR